MMQGIPGGDALIEWFGRVPCFHDAELLEIRLTGPGAGLLRIHAWNMTDERNENGSFILDKHAVVTLALQGVSQVNCVDFDMMPGIVFDLSMTSITVAFFGDVLLGRRLDVLSARVTSR